MSRPRLLLLSMYPLDQGLWGATTRITQLRDALAGMVQLDVIDGRRTARGAAFARYVASGRLRGLDGIYVENSTTLPGPADFAFLALARALRIPVLTYVRDAQQLFAEYYLADTLKRRISRRAFLPATRALMRVSSRVAFPSRGLARAILGDGPEADAALLLPPGARIGAEVRIRPDARGLLFVGSLLREAHGARILFPAMDLARQRGARAELICVSRPGDEAAGPLPAWARVERAEGEAIDRLLGEVRASITPRRKTPYNDLAVPIKVLEYLGYGRPLLVTDTEETSRIVRDAACGLVVPDTVEGLADGILAIDAASEVQIQAWGAAARRAAMANSWHSRAERIVELLA